MSLVRSRIANWFGRRSSSTSTPAWQDRPVRLETLENRCLLSASVTQAPVSAATLPDVPELDANDNGFSQDEFDARGTFTGELKLRRRDDEGRRTYALTLRITSQDEFGNVSGTLSGEQFGETTFDGIFAPARKWFYHLTLPFEGESDSDGRFGGTDARGLFDGHFNPRNFDQVSGGIRDEDNRKFGSFKLNRASSPGDGDGDGDGDGGHRRPEAVCTGQEDSHGFSGGDARHRHRRIPVRPGGRRPDDRTNRR